MHDQNETSRQAKAPRPSNSKVRRRVVTMAAMTIGLVVTPAAALAVSATSGPSTAAATTAATTTTAAPKKTTTSTTTTTVTTTTKTYEVIAGTFKVKANADKRLALIVAKKVTGLTVVKIGKTTATTRYRIEKTGLSKTDARALVKSLHTDKFFAYFVAR